MELPPPVKYRLNEQLYTTFMRRGLAWSTIRRWALPGAGIVSLVVFLRYFQAPWDDGCGCRWTFWVAAAVAVIVSTVLGLALAVAYAWLMVPRQVKAYFADLAYLRDDVFLSFRDGGGSVAYTSSVHEFDWNGMAMWDEGPDFLVIHRSKLEMILLPKSQLPAATVDFVREQLISSGLEIPGKFRK